jgi:Outer membrane protein beta-barrel family
LSQSSNAARHSLHTNCILFAVLIHNLLTSYNFNLKNCNTHKLGWIAGIFLSLILLFAEIIGYGQVQFLKQGTASLSGHLIDSITGDNIPYAVISFLKNDSSLVRFSRSGPDGYWHLINLPAGTFILEISHSTYHEYYCNILIPRGAGITELGIIRLQAKVKNLAPAIVTPRTVIVRLTGDTLEYNTESYTIKPDANIQELISHLPGIQVDPNGGITVNGQRIDRILIDGEDIFKGNPTLITRNFNADMVSKVEILDKKSNEAEFTGVDDGKRTKVLNLVLKKSARNGLFLKDEGGGGPGGYYNINGLEGLFKNELQFTTMAIANNNGLGGFINSMDYGPIAIPVALGADPLNVSAGSGIPKTAGIGGHFSDRWNGGQNHISEDHYLQQVTTQPFSTTVSQQILPDSVYTQAERTSSINSTRTASASGLLEWKSDTTFSTIITAGGMKSTSANEYVSSTTSSFNKSMVNDSKNDINSSSVRQLFNGSIMASLNSRRQPGRKLALSGAIVNQSNISNGYLFALERFYTTGQNPVMIDTTDQRKAVTDRLLAGTGIVTLTQPLGKETVLGLGFDVSFGRSQTFQETFGKSGGKYQQYIDSLSNQYQLNLASQKMTLNIQGVYGRFKYVIGIDLQNDHYRQINLDKDSSQKLDDQVLLPAVSLRYSISKEKSLSVIYSTGILQPTISQQEPVENNTDPLHIYIGNSNLRPSISRSLDMRFMSVKSMVTSFAANLNFLSNAISIRVQTDSLGRQVSEPVNVGGTKTVTLEYSLGKSVKSSGIDFGMNLSLIGQQSASYIGSLLNNNYIYVPGAAFSIGKVLPNVYSIHLSESGNYSFSRNTVNTISIIKYWALAQAGEISYFVLPGIELSSDLSYNWQQKISYGEKDISVLLWNASLSKSVLKDKLTISASVTNIMNQNTGFIRSVLANQFSETTSNVIGRYWMIKVVYRLNQSGKHSNDSKFDR